MLSQQEIEKAHGAIRFALAIGVLECTNLQLLFATESFNKYDVDHSGCIDAWELKEAMKSLGQNPTDEELFALLAQVDSVSLIALRLQGRTCRTYFYERREQITHKGGKHS